MRPSVLVLALLLDGLALAAPAPRRITGGTASPAPIALSDPDGQDLVLEELSARVAVHGPLSLTELELRFRNPHPRRMEGRFSCVLPAGAAISRFAKEVDGRLVEGEVVERLRANRVYDTILHEMRDPALLEEEQGNRFSARIFPIEANATVRLVLSYSRLLTLTDGVRTFELPLRGLPTVGRFRFHALVRPLPGEEVERTALRKGTAETYDMDRPDFTPEDDLVLRFRAAGATPPVRVLSAGEFVLTAFRAPDVAGRPVAGRAARPWIFLVDTSASGADAAARRIEALASVLSALPKGDAVEVVAFDQEVAPLGTRPAGEWAKAIGTALEQRGYLGGTDLASALAHLSRAAAGQPGARCVLVSDGVATLGKTSQAELLAALERLPRAAELSALVLGPRQDEAVLHALVAGRGRVVTLALADGLAGAAREAARRLSLPPGPTLRLSDRAAEWAFPSVVHDVQPGSEVVLLAKVAAGRAPAGRLADGDRVLASAGGVTPLPAGAFEPLLAREAHRAYLGSLAQREAGERDPAVRQALANEQVKVSVEQRVLVPRTTLLVLETEADYARFGLDRRALASILTVGLTGIERLDREAGERFARKTTIAPRKRAAEDERRDLDAPVERQLARERAGRDGTGAKDQEVLEGRRANGSAALLADALPEADGPGVAGGVGGGASGGVSGRANARNNGGIRDGIAGGISDGVVGGMSDGKNDGIRGGISGGRPAPMVAQSAPPPAPRSHGEARPAPTVPAPHQERRPERSASPSWTTPRPFASGELERLAREVAANPRHRTAYNALSDALSASGEWKRLRELALAWQPYDPENPHVYECLGEASLKLGRTQEAARAFGSLVEIAPGKTELLQRAGLLLFRAGATRLAEAPLRRALELRPDRVNAYRHLALVLAQEGRYDEAAEVLERATAQTFPGWYGDAGRVVREELAYVYRAWIESSPKVESEVRARARRFGADLARTDALRVTLAWETDANDVDLHVVDPRGEDCHYGRRRTGSGLELYEDITQGLGPEVVRAGSLERGTYAIGVNYFSAGPMGVSRGVLLVMRPGAGKEAVQVLPFRLVEGGRDMRLLARVEAGPKEAGRVSRIIR